MDLIILVVLAVFSIVLCIVAQVKGSTSYNKYSKVMAKSGITAKELARRILDTAGLSHVKIARVKGTMTDYYDPKNQIVALSDGVMDSSSVSALGIVAHEVGHALQYKANYAPMKIRSVVITISNVMSKLMWPLLIIGVLLDIFIFANMSVGTIFIEIVLAMFIVTTILSFITLPVEYNASNRALKLLKETNTLDKQELVGATAVLRSAGLTYVASFVMTLVNLLRIIYIFGHDR